MNFAEWAARHRRSILFLLFILAAGGAATAFRLPVALFPHVDFPRIRVELDAGDRPADQMTLDVTRPVEEAIRSVPGVREIRSDTSRGAADLSINFDWGANMPLTLQEVMSAVTQTLPSLPKGTTFTARRMDPTVDPVAAFSLTSATESQVALRDLAQYQLIPLLSSVKGVAKVTAIGGDHEEYRVEVDPAKLLAYGLTFADVTKALSATNVLKAVGRLDEHYNLYLMLSDTRLTGVKSIRHTILRSGKNGLVELGDIATVQTATVPHWSTVTADGKRAVSVQIFQQPSGNTVQIVKNIKAKLAAYRSKMPGDITVRNWYDQSQLIIASAGSVRDAILIGVALAALVLFVFLRSVRIMGIAILVVPAVLAATILLLYVLGMSFNIMTLGGMAAAVGLIIDDAIVMIENIMRRVRDGTGNRHDQVRYAAMEFTKPLTGSSLSTIIVFVPLAFLSGVTGAFFKALSLTMASSLIISYMIAWLAIPLLADHLISNRDIEREDEGPLARIIQRRYSRVLVAMLKRPLWLLALIVPLAGVGYVSYHRVGSGFMPAMDEGGFILDYRAEPGTSLAETDRLLRQVGQILMHNPNVATYSRRTGLQLGGGITGTNEGDFFVRLKPQPRETVWQVMDEVRHQVETQVPGLDIDMAQLMEDLIGDLTAVPQPIEIKLFGGSSDELLKTAPKVAAAISKIPGVVDVQDGVIVAGDSLRIQVDRAKAALMGIDPDTVTQDIQNYFSGVVTTHIQKGVRMLGIRVWVPRDIRHSIRDLERMQLRTPSGQVVSLKHIAKVTIEKGQPMITRDQLQRMVAVSARINGRDMGHTLQDVKRVLNQQGLLPGKMYYELGGLYKQQQIAFRGLIAVIIAAFALVFLLLLYLYESFRMAISVILMPLLAVNIVFAGLWLTGIELNITAMMGMTMVVGIVTEVAIFYFSEYKTLTQEHNEPEDIALVKAGVNRMRPIAMTTIAAILALAPLALGIGQGSAMQQPLAIAIISGLFIQMPLVLLAMPVIFALLKRIRYRA
ncbi:efflux RND transporter permease subunit [Mangrovitalea sediminis]|uniref:efflux RND transporter permease subunit n=1 Tax=Mangrovitalea sediminis TaxID=1982043 RepID=UPI000BE5386B|nr:efflux RND transporter permease subunit [Mangrovitalea sediminis]